MNSLEQYISEKLHLNKDNKNLVPKDIDAGEFIESFPTKAERSFITRLIGYCTKHVDLAIKRGKSEHECYVIEYIKDTDKQSGILTSLLNKYGWSDNKRNEKHKVGDVIEYSSGIGTTKYKIIYVVTKNTIIPDKYRRSLVQ